MYVDGMGIISKDGVTDIPTILTRNVGTVDGYLWVADLQDGLRPHRRPQHLNHPQA